MSSLVDTLETDGKLVLAELGQFLAKDVAPFLMTVFASVEKDVLKAVIPIAENAVAEIAASGIDLLKNPAVLGGIFTTTFVQARQAAVPVAIADVAAAVAGAVQAALAKATP